jgi:putative ABC transport system permease protein
VYRFGLRSLLARRRRAGLTTLAVLVGVALISGAYVFTDTIRAAVRSLLSSQAKGAQVVVQSRQGLYSATNPPASVPASLAPRIEQLPGVAAAQGQISDAATIVGSNGKVIRHAGAPTVALSYLPPPFTGLKIIRGSPPMGPTEVALDQATATREHYGIGDEVPIVTGQPVRDFRVSGIASLGSASIGGSTVAVFDLGSAQSLYDKQGLMDVIYVAARRGFSAPALAHEIQPLLPPGLTAQTTSRSTDTNLAQIEDRLRFLTAGLQALGYITLLVGAFVIFNTLAITVAQRARELALLRALGATRAQVLGSVVVEAGAIGALASVAGVMVGLAAGLLMRVVLRAAGVEVPSTHLVLEPRTVAVGLGVGIGVSVAAGLVPAVRATRVAPVGALRASEVPLERRRGVSLLLAGVLAFVGAGLAFSASGSDSARLTAGAVGAVLLVLAAVILIPPLIPGLTRAVAWPLEHRGSIVSRLARENILRTPARTAITGASLMIGLALVLFVSVYASGVRTATRHAISRTFAADFAIGSQDGATSIPAVSARAVAATPSVLAASPIKTASAHLAGAGGVGVAGIDPSSIGQVYRFNWVGAAPALQTLGPGDVLLEHDTARAAGVRLGQRIMLRGADGLRASFAVAGVYSDRGLLRGLALPLQGFDGLFHQSRLQEVLVKLTPGTDFSAAATQLRRALSGLPGVVARSERQLADQATARVNGVLVLFYALLAMVAVMALLGLVNALSLSIHERTRELGVLRSLGMTRRQVRALIRDESVITAAIGTLVGAVLGIALAWVVTRPLSAQGIGFRLPWTQLLLLVAVGLLVGVLAALPPAARAARIDLLSAIAYE